MIGKELATYKHHYFLLVVVESIVLSLYTTSKDQLIQLLCAILVGVFYFGWGVITHAKELKTPRLMLEYATVGLLASTVLIALIRSV